MSGWRSGSSIGEMEIGFKHWWKKLFSSDKQKFLMRTPMRRDLWDRKNMMRKYWCWQFWCVGVYGSIFSWGVLFRTGMFAWYGAAGQLYSCGCTSSTRLEIMSLAMPRLYVALMYSKPASARCTLLESLSNVYTVYCMFEIMLSPTTRREGLLRVGSLPCLCTYLQPWRGTARGLRSFRTCTTTRMQL